MFHWWTVAQKQRISIILCSIQNKSSPLPSCLRILPDWSSGWGKRRLISQAIVPQPLCTCICSQNVLRLNLGYFSASSFHKMSERRTKLENNIPVTFRNQKNVLTILLLETALFWVKMDRLFVRDTNRSEIDRQEKSNSTFGRAMADTSSILVLSWRVQTPGWLASHWQDSC